ECVHRVWALRADGVRAYCTIDAGPQVKVLCGAADADTVAAALRTVPGVVLMGAPAVVAAVDRFVDVRLTLDDAPGPLTVESLAGGTTWVAPVGRNDAPGGDAGAVLAAFRAAAARGAIRPHLAATAVVDSRAF